MTKQFCVYILANGKRGTLYVGVTSNIIKRIWEHKHKLFEGFTAKYDVNRLAYFEMHEHAEFAIRREKRLKFWKRQWKIDVIEKENPNWLDLCDRLLGVEMDPAVKPQDDKTVGA